MAKGAPKRTDYPKGLIGQAKYDAAVKRYKSNYGPPSPKPAKPAKPEGSVNRRGRVVSAKPKPKPTVADYKDGPGNTYDGNSGRLKTAAPRSPAIGAPIHARPQAFGSNTKINDGTLSAAPANGSVFAPQAGQAPRPNTPQPAANPFAGIGDVRGQQMNPEAANMRDAPVQASNQEYQGQTFPGIDANGNDMERRRAFLDADNSLDGMKAVRDLLNRRKLSISVEN